MRVKRGVASHKRHQKIRKATVIPVVASWELNLQQPFPVVNSLDFENVEGLLTPELFSLWRDMISKREREDLGRVRGTAVGHDVNQIERVRGPNERKHDRHSHDVAQPGHGDEAEPLEG